MFLGPANAKQGSGPRRESGMCARNRVQRAWAFGDVYLELGVFIALMFAGFIVRPEDGPMLNKH
jgi:hypothetical protein